MSSYPRNRRYLYIIPCTAVAWTLWTIFITVAKGHDDPVYLHKSRAPLADNDAIQCIPSGIDAFPPDFLSQGQRKQGGVIIHVVIVCYVCAMLAVVCDEYFVPALEAITERLNLSPDVAGATFMAMGASAPELFSSIAGSFVTEDDIGLGTILGSAVFNILGISGIVGLVLWNQPLSIQRYPVIRDGIVYGLTVLMLSYIIMDNIVMWWEALILVLIFCSYIVLMNFNAKIESAVQNLVAFCRKGKQMDPEKDSLQKRVIGISPDGTTGNKNGFTKETESTESHTIAIDSEDDDDNVQCCCVSVWHVVMWLPSLVFRLTIPPVRWYPATFIVSIAWMGGLSYIAVWMVTIIGYTLSMPGSVSGLTLLAAGSSVPDLISTVLVARTGKGNMAISNLLGSNTFDLAFCLGTPWFIKTLTSGGRLLVYSSAMVYTVTTLLVTLIALLITFQLNGWKLNKISGMVCLSLYVVCITLACLYELNVFGVINKPVCS